MMPNAPNATSQSESTTNVDCEVNGGHREMAKWSVGWTNQMGEQRIRVCNEHLGSILGIAVENDIFWREKLTPIRKD